MIWMIPYGVPQVKLFLYWNIHILPQNKWKLLVSVYPIYICGDNPTLDLANVLKESLIDREATIIKTPLMVQAIFLDPRFKSQLDSREVTFAEDSLQKLSRQIQPNPTQLVTANHDIDKLIEEMIVDQNEIDVDDLLEQNRMELALEFANYKQKTYRDFKCDAINFWKEEKKNFPKIGALAEIVFSMSPTQSACERSFSAFSYIYSARRMNLMPKNVTNILLIRLNRQLFYDLKQSKLDAIMST